MDIHRFLRQIALEIQLEKDIVRMLSARGNPTMDNLTKINRY